MPKGLILTSHSKAILQARETTQGSRLRDITQTKKIWINLIKHLDVQQMLESV